MKKGFRGACRGQERSTRRPLVQAVALGLLILAGRPPSRLDAQASAPRYQLLQLDCARFRQEIHSAILLEGGGSRSRETTWREGELTLRATPSDDGIALVAWFDTLTVWREGSGQRLIPETDGVVGGRFRGLLTAAGVFTSSDRPFVPDEVAQVADVGDALERLLPRLPPAPLERGQSSRDDDGLVITRLADGSVLGRVTHRFRLTTRFEGDDLRLLPDSTPVTAHRSETETGVYDWLPELGVVRWERQVSIDVAVPAGGVVKSAFRTRIEQQAATTRLEGSCSAP
jgi:hypothetical protein